MAHADLPGGVSIFYEISGMGPPLVLAPGWTLNHHLWDLVLPEMERFCRVVRYDPRGSGLSAADPGLEYSTPADAEDLEGLLDSLSLESAHLAGHSKGARAVLAFSMLHPERVLSVTAVGSGEPHPHAAAGGEAREAVHCWARSLHETAQREGVAASLEAMREGGPLGPVRLDAERFRTFRRATRGYTGADLASIAPRRSLDTGALAGRLTMPVLYLCGEMDPSLEECRYAHGRVPGSVLEVIPGCGHFPPLERPGTTARALLDFIDSAQVFPNGKG
jgi:pimeloyl-ACP methyl ester carboxylesterase